MVIPAVVREYLRRKGGHFWTRVVPVAADLAQAVTQAKLPGSHVAQATVVTTGKSALMVIHPVTHEPDMKALETIFHRPFGPCGRRDLERIFHDCDLRALPPLPEAYGMKAVVDASFAGAGEIYFAPGRTGLVVRASGEEFARLTEGAWQRSIAKPRVNAAGEQRVSTRFPPLPELAAQVMRLRDNPYSHASELAAIVEQDPDIAEQVVAYASSPFYGYKAKVETVAGAIACVLGMDFATDFTIAMALGKSLDHPYGDRALPFWRHAIHAGALSQALSMQIPYMLRPSPGAAFLAGFTQNFGSALAEQAFPERLKSLHEERDRQPQRARSEIEKDVLGCTHADLGATLMEHWGMPREIVQAVREHHAGEYRGDFAMYANLAHIADVMLKSQGIGEAWDTQLSGSVLAAVGIDEIQADTVLHVILECRDSLEFIAKKTAFSHPRRNHLKIRFAVPRKAG